MWEMLIYLKSFFEEISKFNLYIGQTWEEYDSDKEN
jgi:hypothetical protein